MTIKSSTLCCLTAFSTTLAFLAPVARAQNAVAPAVGGRLSVLELRDTSLADALELIYRSAGNPAHIIDESAQTVMIPLVSLSNIAWEAAVLNLTRPNGFKVSRNSSGAYVVEPRNPVGTPDGAGGSPNGVGGPPFGPSSPSRPGTLPSNPFGRRPTTQARPSIRTFANSQTRPGGRAGGGNGSTEGKRFQIIVTRHVYAGGIARIFEGGTVIPTYVFVSPATAGVTAFGGISTGGSGSSGGTGNTGGSGGSGGGFGGSGGGTGGGFGGSGGGSGGGITF